MTLKVYAGRRRQRGYGLGGLFSSLFAAPLLKQGLKTVGKQALRTGAGVLGDVLEGRQFKESLAARAEEGGRNLGRQALTAISTPKKRNKRPAPDPLPFISPPAKQVRRRKRKGAPATKDIFS